MEEDFRIKSKLFKPSLSFFSFVQLLLYVHYQRDTQISTLRLRSSRAGCHKHTQVVPSLKVLLSEVETKKRKKKKKKK